MGVWKCGSMGVVDGITVIMVTDKFSIKLFVLKLFAILPYFHTSIL